MMTSEGAQSTENVSSLMRAQDVNHHGGVNKVKLKKELADVFANFSTLRKLLRDLI